MLQFAVGGRVYPPADRWIKITERFRGQVLRIRAQQVSGNPQSRFDDLAPQQRGDLQLISGKDAHGRPLPDHQHAYFILWPDQHGQPTRLVCLRNGEPFSDDEVEALLKAAERTYSWEFGNPDWTLRLVPLPFETAAPLGASCSEFTIWTSKTPFVPPGNRHRFRGNGRERPGELPHEVLRKLIVKHGLPAPVRIEPLDAAGEVANTPESLAGWSDIGQWVSIHETRAERLTRRSDRTRAVRLGYRFRIVFSEPAPGPVCLGQSNHFGLGLFVPAGDVENE
jgi:CRISPR-associated protein Csb2